MDTFLVNLSHAMRLHVERRQCLLALAQSYAQLGVGKTRAFEILTNLSGEIGISPENLLRLVPTERVPSQGRGPVSKAEPPPASPSRGAGPPLGEILALPAPTEQEETVSQQASEAEAAGNDDPQPGN